MFAEHNGRMDGANARRSSPENGLGVLQSCVFCRSAITPKSPSTYWESRFGNVVGQRGCLVKWLLTLSAFGHRIPIGECTHNQRRLGFRLEGFGCVL